MPAAPSAPAAPVRFRPSPWLALVATALVVAGVSLGNWQGRRAQEKEAIERGFEAARAQPPLTLAGAPSDATALRFRRVRAEGVFLPRHTILLDNRVLDGRPGYAVITPLVLADGSHVLVDRGWMPAGPRREQLAAPPPPEGRVRVEGRLNLPSAGRLELGPEAPEASVWQNLDLARFARRTGLAVAPLVIEQEGADPAGLVRERAPPRLDPERNRGYMWQWYALAALAVVFFLVLSVRRAGPGESAR